MPSVSVVIPAYNAAAFIAEAVRSVLDQACEVEVIVVDDGSTDDTANEAARFGDAIRLIRSGRNEGLPAALNRGVDDAGADIIGFLDADDLWAPGRLVREMDILGGSSAALLWGRTGISFLDPDGGSQSSPDWPPRHYPALGAMLFRREVFDAVGRFDTRLRHAQDIDFLARVFEARIAIERHDEVVLTWRRHRANMTNNVELDRQYFVTAITDALKRRRAASADAKAAAK